MTSPYRIVTMGWLYRCPDCRHRLPRVETAMPAVHHYCAACNVEWDTGIEEQDPDVD